MRAETKDRRRGSRNRARLRVRMWNDEIDVTGLTRDISVSGVFVETRVPVPQRSRVHLELTLESGSFYAEGIVARTVKAPRALAAVKKPGVGVRFVGLLEEFYRETAAEPTDQVEMDLTDPEQLATVYARDIKRGGLFVLTDDPPERDSTVTIRLRLPHPHGDFDVRAVVIHVMNEPSGVGVQLLDLDELREKVGKIVDA